MLRPAERIRWVAAHWRPYRHLVPWLLLMAVLNAAVLVALPLVLRRMVDGIEQDLSRSFLHRNVVLLLGLGLLHGMNYFAMVALRARTNLSLDLSVRMRAFQALLRMGSGFTSRYRTGDLVTRLTDDVTHKLAWFLCSGLFRTVEAGLVIVFGVVMMLRLDAGLTLWAAGPLPVLLVLFVITARHLDRRYRDVQAAISRVNDRLESAFGGIRVIKGFAMEGPQEAAVAGVVEDQRRAEVRAVQLQTVIDSLYGNVWQLAIVGVLLAGGARVIEGRMTLGTLIAFDSYILLLVWPMFDLGQFLVRGRLSAVSIDRIHEVESAPPEVPATGSPVGLTPHSPRIRAELREDVPDEPLPVALESVSYRYPGADRDALSGVSFAAAPGTLTAVAGAVGSGKSTLLTLVPRLAEPTDGCIRVGGRALADWPVGALRQQVGWVPQEAVLFSDTIRENIRMGRGWVSDADVAMAVEVSGLGRDLPAFPDGLETEVGTRGMRLSGGQKQRLSLARALAGRPRVLLLDDCTASLDAETEDAVWRALERELPRCTTLAVTHRPATLERADRILLLEEGRPVEEGTFEELERPGTRFHALYRSWRAKRVSPDYS